LGRATRQKSFFQSVRIDHRSDLDRIIAGANGG